jgi:hypothetical protein
MGSAEIPGAQKSPPAKKGSRCQTLLHARAGANEIVFIVVDLRALMCNLTAWMSKAWNIYIDIDQSPSFQHLGTCYPLNPWMASNPGCGHRHHGCKDAPAWGTGWS